MENREVLDGLRVKCAVRETPDWGFVTTFRFSKQLPPAFAKDAKGWATRAHLAGERKEGYNRQPSDLQYSLGIQETIHV
jgi:hypothetical protein